MTDLAITAAVAVRARDLQLALTRRGHHRAASPTDLVVAAAAAEHGATVVHYDRDFDLIATVGGPRAEWVAPARLAAALSPGGRFDRIRYGDPSRCDGSARWLM